MFRRNIVVLFLEQLNLSRSKLNTTIIMTIKINLGKHFIENNTNSKSQLSKLLLKKNNQKTNNDNKTQRMA